MNEIEKNNLKEDLKKSILLEEKFLIEDSVKKITQDQEYQILSYIDNVIDKKIEEAIRSRNLSVRRRGLHPVAQVFMTIGISAVCILATVGIFFH